MPARFIDKMLSLKSRWAYALWTVLAFNGLANAYKSPDWTSFYFWIFRLMAVSFGAAWFIATLSRLREFGWSLSWVVPFTITWFGVIWIFWWNPGRIGIPVLLVWLVSQAFLILKEGRATSYPGEAEKA